MNPAHQISGHQTVATDLLYEKKAAFLNLPLFAILSLAFFGMLDLDVGSAAEGLLHPGRGRRHSLDPQEPLYRRLRASR